MRVRTTRNIKEVYKRCKRHIARAGQPQRCLCACPRPRRGGLEEATSVLFSFPDDFIIAIGARRADDAPL